jgi:NADH-quinone oxidoreductase subunit M
MLWMYQRVMFGPITNPENEKLVDLSGLERAVLVPILVMIVLMGVYPKPFLSRMEPAVTAYLARIETKIAEAQTASTALARLDTAREAGQGASR